MTSRAPLPRLWALWSAVAAIAGASLLMGAGAPAPSIVSSALAPSPTPFQRPDADAVTLMVHDSFVLSEGVLAAFEAQHGVALRVLRSGDAGLMVNSAILSKGNPVADVLYGIDTTFLSRGLSAGIFEPYGAAGLDGVPVSLRADLDERVTPIDFGDVCLNLDRDAFEHGGLVPPERLEDLTRPDLRGTLVVEDSATSSPGLAFLLATIVRFGETGDYPWQLYWRDLRANDVLVASDWEIAYRERFSGGTSVGDRPLVVSYASSPAAEVFFADPQPEEAPTAALLDGCFRQVEFAGVLAGTSAGDLARAVIDFLLSPEVQEDIPLNMFVYPAVEAVPIPELFSRFAQQASQPLVMDAARIEEHRDRWIEEWTDIVLR